jgi:MFS family permease
VLISSLFTWLFELSSEHEIQCAKYRINDDFLDFRLGLRAQHSLDGRKRPYRCDFLDPLRGLFALPSSKFSFGFPHVATLSPDLALKQPNIRRFIAFRILFNARFYYPVFTILFLDFGLSLEQFAILNAAWAATIVLLEVPSGALADTIGRRNLVIAAALIMILEMALLCFAPIGNMPIVFYLFLINRILSGAAEASASGADEALAYDTLKDLGMEKSWGRVLESQMRYQSIAFILAMSLGALLYDADRLNQFLAFASIDIVVAKETAMRLPLILTLLLGIGAFFVAIGLKEPKSEQATRKKLRYSEARQSTKAAFAKTLATGKWILNTPAALMIILAGFLIDHMVRMILTLNSEYYRRIDLPEAAFGLISACFGVMGIFMPKLGRWLSENRTKSFNYYALAIATFLGLFGMSWFVPYWGIAPMVLIYGAISLTGFLVSAYLNEITASESRATALSFKGLSYNLAYGGIGILYSLLVYNLRNNQVSQGVSDETIEANLFQDALGYFPSYFAAAFCIVLLYGILNRRSLDLSPSKPFS